MNQDDYPALTKRQAEVYHLHKIEKLKHKEIGKKFGIKWQTSRTLFYRACRRLEEMETTLESAKRGE